MLVGTVVGVFVLLEYYMNKEKQKNKFNFFY